MTDFPQTLSGGSVRGRLAVLVFRGTHAWFSQDSQENIRHHSWDSPTPLLGALCIPLLHYWASTKKRGGNSRHPQNAV